jgi:hypothetical protein
MQPVPAAPEQAPVVAAPQPAPRQEHRQDHRQKHHQQQQKHHAPKPQQRQQHEEAQDTRSQLPAFLLRPVKLPPAVEKPARAKKKEDDADA